LEQANPGKGYAVSITFQHMLLVNM